MFFYHVHISQYPTLTIDKQSSNTNNPVYVSAILVFLPSFGNIFHLPRHYFGSTLFCLDILKSAVTPVIALFHFSWSSLKIFLLPASNFQIGFSFFKHKLHPFSPHTGPIFPVLMCEITGILNRIALRSFGFAWQICNAAYLQLRFAISLSLATSAP